jgi:HAD superfamily hydrolase (TIGR01509 family)
MQEPERRVLLLDVMGTLVRDPFYEDMPRALGMSFDELLRVKHPRAWVDFEHGHTDEPTFLGSFFADGREYDHDAFVGAVVAGFRFLDGIEPLLEALDRRGIEMHALSNYPCWWRRIEEKLALSRYLRWSFVSCETGVRKPDPRAFLGAATALGVSPDACIFVDDVERNCRAAREVGMDAIRFESAAQLREELARRGLL